MKKSARLSVIFMCATFLTFAQTDDPATAGDKDESFLTFDLKLAPNTQGALEGSAVLGVLWGDWFETRGTFAVSSFTSVWSENGGSTTSIESNKNLDVDVLRTRSNFLKLSFAGDDYYAALNLSALLNLAWISKERYGYGTGPAFTFFSTQNMFLLYPFGNAELDVKLGPFSLGGYFRQSITSLYTKVDGQFYYSTVGAAVPFSTEDRGYETRFGGAASWKPIPELELKYGFDYLRHIGYTYGYIVGGGPTEFVYEAVEMKHRVTLTLDVFGYKPVIGVTYVDYRFSPVALYSIPAYTNGRVSFVFGLIYQ